MNALRGTTALRYVQVSRVPITRSAHSHAIAYWQKFPVRPGARLPPHLPPRPVPLNSRAFRHLAQQEKENSASPVPKQVTPAGQKATVSNAEQRRRDWAVVRRLAVHIWPKNDWATRGRVVLGVGLLVCGKVRRV